MGNKIVFISILSGNLLSLCYLIKLRNMFFFIVYGIGAVASVTVVVTEYTLRLIFSDYFCCL